MRIPYAYTNPILVPCESLLVQRIPISIGPWLASGTLTDIDNSDWNRGFWLSGVLASIGDFVSQAADVLRRTASPGYPQEHHRDPSECGPALQNQ